jgi:dUTP pyrophosphatase
MEIRIVNRSDYPLPKYETKNSAGVDLRSNLQTFNLEPFTRVLIPTGIFIEIPEGYEGQVRPRSGLALKRGLTVLNSPGTIDADYRGEVGVILINLSEENQLIEHGERVAQLVFNKVERVEFIQVESLTVTERGTGSFGHTGGL